MTKITNLLNNTNFPLNYYFLRDNIEYKTYNLTIQEFYKLRSIHNSQGIYVIYDHKKDEIWYVGYTLQEGFWKRIKKHINRITGKKAEKVGAWHCCSLWIKQNNYDFINNCSIYIVETKSCHMSLLEHIESGLIYELKPLANKETFEWEKVKNFTNNSPTFCTPTPDK